MQIHLFERHQLLLLLLMGLEIMKQQGKLSVEEMDVLGRALVSIEMQVDLSLSSDSGPASSKHDPVKPTWLSDEVMCALFNSSAYVLITVLCVCTVMVCCASASKESPLFQTTLYRDC